MQLAGELLETGGYRQKAEDCARPYGSSFPSVLCRERGTLRCQLQTLCLQRSIACCKRHGRICGRFTPVRKRVSARSSKFRDQLPNLPDGDDAMPPPTDLGHLDLLRTTLREYRQRTARWCPHPSLLLSLSTGSNASHPIDTLVNAVVRICASQGRVRETSTRRH